MLQKNEIKCNKRAISLVILSEGKNIKNLLRRRENMRKTNLMILTLLILSVMTNLSFGTTSYEMDLSEKELSDYGTRFSSISYIQGKISVNSRSIDVDAALKATAGDNTKLYVYLQRSENGSWKTIETFSNSENSQLCGLSETVYTATNYKFRLKITARVYDGSSLLENATIYEY